MSWEMTMPTVGAVVGRYASQGDVESIGGAENVRVWSNLENEDDEVDTARVRDALEYADAVIDALMAEGPYAVPLALGAGETIVRTWAGRLAAVWLWRGRTPGRVDETSATMVELERKTFDEIAQVRRGARRLGAALSQQPQPSCPTVVME